MNELLETFQFLTDSIPSHPMLELINTVIWLDPFWDSPDEVEYDDDHVGRALYITRNCFVDIYAGVTAQMRSNLAFDDNAAGWYIVREISKQGIPVNDPEQMGWGIPMDPVGINLRSGDTYLSHPEIVPLLRLFGAQVDPDAVIPDDYDPELDDEYYGDEDFSTDGIEIPSGIYRIARLICTSLDEIDQETSLEWFRVNRFIQWVFGVSGNTLIDCTEYDLQDMQPLDWKLDDIETAKAVMAEVSPFMLDALIGREILDDTPAMMKILKKNVKRVKKAIKTHDSSDNISVRLDWGITRNSADREAIDDPELLLVRRDAA